MKERCKQLPYAKAIRHITEIMDITRVQSPFKMICIVHDLSKRIEECINEFWDGIANLDHDKLVIGGDNLYMLYLYVVLQSKIPSLYAYVKLIEEFSTLYLSC